MVYAGELNNQENAADKICLECNREFTGIYQVCPHDNSVLVQKIQDPWIGATLAGTYEILSIAGHGGMGVVYRARHTLMDRIVAVKMLQTGLVSDTMSFKRFRQEGKAASKIKHENVITTYDFGISPTGQPYIVMDFLEGVSLADEIKRAGQLSVERTLKIVSQSCEALAAAHKQGIIHRDLKPSNIILTRKDDEEDFVQVVDFGVATLMPGVGQESQRLTQPGEVCGSPVYMSPEQCMGMELNQCSDIYSMGIVLYETLTGKLPILGKTMVDTMGKHISETPPSFKEARPDLYIPERLEHVIFRALAKAADERYQSMLDLKQDLETSIPKPGRSQILRTEALKAERPTKEVVEEYLKAVPRKVWFISAGSAAALVLMCSIILMLALNHPSTSLQPVPAPPTTTSAPPVNNATPVTPTASPVKQATAPVNPTQAPEANDAWNKLQPVKHNNGEGPTASTKAASSRKVRHLQMKTSEPHSSKKAIKHTATPSPPPSSNQWDKLRQLKQQLEQRSQ